MKLEEFAKSILFSEDLNSKLFNPEHLEYEDFNLYEIPSFPSRNNQIKFTDKQLKFPKKNTLNLNDKKAVALHSFANHELLAIEMMACALLILPNNSEEMIKLKKGIITALKDEQVHFQMYRNRIQELGYEFGDFPLNDFFWRQMPNMNTAEKFLSVMSVTFEAANLDFAKYYEAIFTGFDDKKTAGILKKVYEDEISHVALGVNYLNRWRGDKSLWEYYLSVLPFPITPDRSKGICFVAEARSRAGLDHNFVENVKNYQDDFQVTKRKEWKN